LQSIVPRLAVSLAALVAAAVLPATALAADATGRGENITPVKNISYPNLQAPAQKNAGTDVEFATITVASPNSGGNTGGGSAGGGTTGAAPGTPGAAAPRSTARSRRLSKRARAARRAATRATKRCSAARKKARKAKSRRAKRSANRRARKLCASARKARARARKLSRQSTAINRSNLRDAKPEQPGLQRTFAFAGSYGDGLQIIDVTDPANSEIVATWDCGVSQGDVQVFQRPDLGGRWFVTYTMDDGYDWFAQSNCAKEVQGLGFKPQDTKARLSPAHKESSGLGTYIAEVTNPYAPKGVSYVPVKQASHNQTVHPSGKFLYNSNSDLMVSAIPAIEIIDITNIHQPKSVGELPLKTFPGLGTESHDVTFSADGKRAYTAALSHGEVIDSSDPAKPKSIGTIVDPMINVWHQANEISIKDPILGERKFLIAEDEVAGASGTGQCPNGAVHVYDITGSNETHPVKVGTWNISDTGPTDDGVGTCTAHVFELHEKSQLMTIAYYNGGVRVVDLSGLVGVAIGKSGIGMKQLGFYRFKDSDTWSVKAYEVDRKGFYLFGNDNRRGFDVYKYAPTAAPSAQNQGIWRSPEEQVKAMEAYKAQGGKLSLEAICLLTQGTAIGVDQAAQRAGLELGRQ
jgi:hypothetical protein